MYLCVWWEDAFGEALDHCAWEGEVLPLSVYIICVPVLLFLTSTPNPSFEGPPVPSSDTCETLLFRGGILLRMAKHAVPGVGGI